MYELNGRVAIVTGAARGLGLGIAEAFAKQGAIVVPTDRPGVSLDETAETCGRAGAAEVYRHDLDITDRDSIDRAVADVKGKYGHIDILANNAGLNRPKPSEEITEELWDSVMDVNLKGSFFMAQAALPVMRAQGRGRILFTSSVAGLVARENQAPYCVSKGGINSMVRSLAFDCAAAGITVNAVAPCFAMTALSKARLEDPEYRAMVLGMIPAGRLVEPSEVGALFAYLASDEAAMITGQTIVIDGGWTMW
ncbi:MAG: SDR family oxidoreductase [Clostridiales Family XIII bacterium]|jgi:NAD(P)-dependent dehydrogenase (short-subunit alcohol dehydrogenase family)|nr:SDR family oxidoreductase [Clostridiales Family XIII bacterium]